MSAEPIRRISRVEQDAAEQRELTGAALRAHAFALNLMHSDLADFRAETAQAFTEVHADLADLRQETDRRFSEVQSTLTEVQTTLTEVLRRLPPVPGDQADPDASG